MMYILFVYMHLQMINALWQMYSHMYKCTGIDAYIWTGEHLHTHIYKL